MSNSKLFAKLEKLPTDITKNIIDFADCVRASDNKSCIRCTLDTLLNDAEVTALKKHRFIAYVGTCNYRYAPEIKHTYFYVV